MLIQECNEITVKIKGTLDNFYKTIEQKGFKITDKFSIDDTFFIPSTLKINELSTREILSNAVLVRVIDRMPEKIIKNITFKSKQFDEQGNILSQSKVECAILNTEDAKNLLTSMGYKNIMQIKESDIVYEKDGFEFSVKNIENGENLIEAETDSSISTIESLKEKFDEYEIPIYKDNYFVKKAEIELNKILKRK